MSEGASHSSTSREARRCVAPAGEGKTINTVMRHLLTKRHFDLQFSNEGQTVRRERGGKGQHMEQIGKKER